MALVSQGWSVGIELVDVGANSTKLTFYGPFADATEAEAGRAALLAEYGAVTNSLVKAMFIAERFEEDTAVVGAGQNENQAVVVCRLDPISSGKLHNFRIVNPTDGIFVGSTGAANNEIDPNDADLLALLELFTAADGVFTLSDGESLADTTIVKSGKRIHRKSRNG